MFAASVQAGVNHGGTLIVHVAPPVQGSPCWEGTFPQCVPTDPCINLDVCENARTTFSGSNTTVFSVLAAFPTGSSPRMRGLTFGLDYDQGVGVIVTASCGDFELSDSHWPDSGSGTALTWNTPRTDPLNVIYFFGGYNYYAPQPAMLRLVEHPTQGGYFGDDSIPSVLDPIAGYGALGFNQPGVLTCPDQIATLGACCLSNGDCVFGSESDCLAQGGVFQGGDTSCSPNPCPAGTGACCSPGVCFMTTPIGCEAEFGYYLGDGTDCDPDPCPSVMGACCFAGNEQCLNLSVWACLELDGIFQGDGTDCDPNPCSTPAKGACCLTEGACQFLTAGDCAALDGQYLGDGSVCEPNPCVPVAIDRQSWGSIKGRYR